MNFELVTAVFELVGDGDDLPRQLLRLAHGDKSRAEAIGQRRRKNKSARFDSGDDVHMLPGVMLAQPVHQGMKAARILQQRGQIVKENARLWIIGYLANQFFQIVHLLLYLQPSYSTENPRANSESYAASSSVTFDTCA